MKLADYATYDGVGLAQLIAKRDITASEACASALAVVERLNPVINCVVQAHPERAAAPADKPAPAGLLGGVPTLLKDFYKFERGCLSEGGSELTRGLVGTHDSE